MTAQPTPVTQTAKVKPRTIPEDPYTRNSLLVHRAKLEDLNNIPEPLRDWQWRGSVKYREECIRILENWDHNR